MTSRPTVDVLLGHAFFMALDAKQAARQRPYTPLGTLYAAAQLESAGCTVAVFDAMLARDEAEFEVALQRHAPSVVVLFEDSFNFLSKMCLARMRRSAIRMIESAARRGLPVLVAGSDATDAPAAYLAAGATAVMLGEADHTVVEAVQTLLERAPALQAGSGSGPHASHRAVSDLLAEVPGLALASGTVESDNVDRAARRAASQPSTPIDKPQAALRSAGDGIDLLDSAVGNADRGLHRTLPRPPERRPDVFPWPARQHVDIAAYASRWRAKHGRFSLNMVSTRGCPFHCNWCAKPIWGQRYAMRTAEDVAAEMAHIRLAYAPDHIWFADDIFGLRPEWTVEFGNAVARLGASIPFQIQSRVDLMTEAAVDGLARAGCEEVWLGVESGSQRILDAMEKGIQVDAVGPATQRLRGKGIRVGYFLQLGYPGEEWSDIEATARIVREQVPDAIGVSVSYPLPGTRFHAAVADQLGQQTHWRETNDLAMMFHGTYDSELYRELRDLLHAEHEALLSGADLEPLRLRWRRLKAGEPSRRRPDATTLPLPELRPAPDLAASAN